MEAIINFGVPWFSIYTPEAMCVCLAYVFLILHAAVEYLA